jgi:hypothetical protein
MKRSPLLVTAALALTVAAGGASAATIKPWFEFKKAPLVISPDDLLLDKAGASAPVFNAGSVRIGFEGISQYDAADFARNFIPPDTMGAVGKTQFLSVLNGGVGVFDKATGASLAKISDVAFWANAGIIGTSGDPRVMYNAQTNRWIVAAFGNNPKDLQIAVSDTHDALGGWKAVTFEGFGSGFLNPVADYPTLALDSNAVYIGTNNFGATSSGGASSFRGTTLNVIPLDSLFGAADPTLDGLKQFVTPCCAPGSDLTRGFAIQGVNSSEASSTGNVLAVSLTDFALVRYDVLNAGTAGATLTPSVMLGSPYTFNDPGRQPSGLRNIDTLDDRVGTSVWEQNGRIYAVHTVTPEGGDETRVRIYVIDSVTNTVLDEYEIGSPGYDYYMGSIAVNEAGYVVVGYNRSGFGPDGKVSVMTRAFETLPDGTLAPVGLELLLKESLTDRYLNGNPEASGTPLGRQRWGDYSAVTIDPEDSSIFWLIGQFAREANTPENGHPGGTGFSRWGTWIAAVDLGRMVTVPEPGSLAIMMIGLMVLGASVRRRRWVSVAN